MFDNFTLAGLTISNLQAQVLGFLGNPFVVAAIVAVLALFFVSTIGAFLASIGGMERVLRDVRWRVTNQEGKLYDMGEDPGDVEFWYDHDVRRGWSKPVGFKRTANYRLQKHRSKAG